MKYITLYHNTSNANAIKINDEGIKGGMRLNAYGKGSEAEGAGVWCTTERGYGYGGATITFQIDENDESLRKQNDTEYIVYRDVKPSEILDIDLQVSEVTSTGPHNTMESDIPAVIKKHGKDKVLQVFKKYENKFIEPYNYDLFLKLIETGNKYCRGSIKLEESNFRAFKFINHKKTQVDEGNNRQELEDKYEGSEIFVDENDDISKMCESNQYPLDVKDIKNLNQWFRDNIDKEPDEDWRNRLKDAYDCSYTQIFKGSPLKRKREIVQQYLDYKNKIEESKKSDDLYYTIYNHAKKLIELNPNIEPDKLNMSNTYLTDDLETTRTYNEVLKKIDSLTKYLDTDIKLGVISEEKAQYKRDIAGIMKRYVDMRINTIRGIKTESTHKLEEASRNELLALAKSETITRYNKSAGYKGFYLVDIDTTAIKTRDALIITNKVGKYYDTIELEDILYWIGLEVDNSRDKKATVENVRKALRGAMDGMDIKVDCSCPDFRFRFSYQATVLGYKYGKPETREAKITNPHNYGSACKHLIAMLSNKQWIEQVASTVTDWVVENVEWVREFLQVTEDEFKVPDEYARYIGKHGAMKKAWDKIPDKDTEKEEQDQEMNQEEQPEEDIQDEIPEENNAENQESNEELEEK